MVLIYLFIKSNIFFEACMRQVLLHVECMFELLLYEQIIVNISLSCKKSCFL